ncbi:MAG: carboxylesterase family protein [Acidobacteriaceae bacterium]
MFAPFGKNTKKAKAAYGAKPDSDLRFPGMKVAADAMMIEPARFVAQTLSAQGDPVWEYQFGYVADSMRKQWPGAPHAAEIPFVFDTVKAKYGAAATSADVKAREEVNDYWANFVKTGNPNGEGLPHWPRYSVKTGQLMLFTENHGPEAMADPWKARLNLTEAVADQKMNAQP